MRLVYGGFLIDSWGNVLGSEGADYLIGGADAEPIYGNGGNDRLAGGAGDDMIDGGFGDDVIAGGPGNDTLRGGSGRDTLDLSAAPAGVQVSLRLHTAVGDGFDRIGGFDNVLGSRFADTVYGDAGDNRLTGGAGDDFLDGRDGRDTVVYYDAPGAVLVDLAASMADGHGHDTLVDVESVVGSRFGDVLRGDGRDNWLTGREGDDLLDGRGGSDVANFAYAAAGVDVRLEDLPGSGQGHAVGEGFDTLRDDRIGADIDRAFGFVRRSHRDERRRAGGADRLHVARRIAPEERDHGCTIVERDRQALALVPFEREIDRERCLGRGAEIRDLLF